MSTTSGKYAYTTLVTRSSYLPGAIILAYTLKKQESKYPLIIIYTDTLPRNCISVLEKEHESLNIVLRKVDALLPNENVRITLIAERFADTWTKLRVFEILNYDKVCYLDADMMILKNADNVFDVELPGPDWLGAAPVCCCNLDKDPWAPEDWVKENCAYTVEQHPEALTHPITITPQSLPTHQLLNGGTFVYHPSRELWDRMLHFFNTTLMLADFKFPDQDFLAEFFRGKWVNVGWRYNALKTMRYWHPNIWRNEEVVCLHYIVDKPWAKRVRDDGIAGYLGKDGVTHRWWWEMFADWQATMEASRRLDGLEEVKKYVAKPIAGDLEEENEELSAVGGKVQAFAKNGRVEAA